MTKLIIFDLDGTLLNTLEDLADAANHVLAQHGLPTHPVDAYRYFVGNGMPTLIHRILPEGQKEGALYETCFKEFLEYYTLHMHDKTSVYEGLTETLEQLQAKGIKLAVATNKVHTALKPLMDAYFPKFSICQHRIFRLLHRETYRFQEIYALPFLLHQLPNHECTPLYKVRILLMQLT